MATWRPAGGASRVVLVDEPAGAAYVCTDPATTVTATLGAVAQVHSDVAEGYGSVVDIDLEGFPDRVNHDAPRQPRLFRLIRMWGGAVAWAGRWVEPPAGSGR